MPFCNVQSQKIVDEDPYFQERVYASSNYRQRRWGLRAFCCFAKKAPSELIYERQSDLKCNEPLVRVCAENRLRKFLKKLEAADAGYNKRRNIFNLVKNFYSHFGFDLSMRRSDAPKGESGKVYPMTRELLQKVLEVCDVRDRALVLLMKDSGQAVAEIASLKLAHLDSDGENLDPEKWLIPIKLTRKKTRSKIETFVGEEAIQALNLYFDLRRRGTTELYKGRWYGKKGLQPEVLSGESPVIARKCGGHLSSESISYIVSTLVKKAGIKADVRAHSIRRFFETTFENPEIGIHPAWIKLMMGHKPTQNERAYSHPTVKQLLEAYVRGYGFLRVQGQQVDQGRLRIERAQADDMSKRLMELERKLMVLDNPVLLKFLRQLEDG